MAAEGKAQPTTHKASPKPRTTHVFAVPIVELTVGPRCAHGCFVISSTSPTVWHFEGLAESIEVGPGMTEADVLIHAHTGDDDLVGDDDCFDECWEGSED